MGTLVQLAPQTNTANQEVFVMKCLWIPLNVDLKVSQRLQIDILLFNTISVFFPF